MKKSKYPKKTFSPKLFIAISTILILLTGFFFKDDLFRLLADKKENELEKNTLVEEIKQETGKWQEKFKQPIFLNTLTVKPPLLAERKEEETVLGAAEGENKWIEINIGKQRIYAHEADKIVYEFPVSTGKWAPTPTGEFRIWIKLRYSTMQGGSKELGTYYYLPNVPYTMYFYKGYAIHGAYWHNNFGQPMSHGCVNLSIPDAEKIFFWANPIVPDGKSVAYPTKEDPGTKVVISS